MSENGSIEDNRVGNSSEKTEEEIREARVLTQEARRTDSAVSRDGDNTSSEPLPKG